MTTEDVQNKFIPLKMYWEKGGPDEPNGILRPDFGKQTIPKASQA